MNRLHQKRRKLTPGAEMLESRALLNGHLPHHSFVHVSAVSSHSAGQIKGTLAGQSPYTSLSETNNVYLGSDTYTASGNTNRGSATVTGQDSDNSILINPTTYKDTYYGGNWNLTLSNGSTVAIAYVGSGPSPTGLGPYTAHLQGEAIGTSGSLAGHMYSFTAKLSGEEIAAVGNEIQETVTIKFTLKG